MSNFPSSPPSILDPERWNIEKKKSDTPTENGSRAGDGPEHRRRPGDPRERLRKENDGIVLSPQRRSFNSGCFVPVRETGRSNRSHSPLNGKNEPSHVGELTVFSYFYFYFYECKYQVSVRYRLVHGV